MKKIFGIQNFRLCQEGVCNANMDGRDVVCIMPTGGGKSLTYQLPAVLTPGCTLVISPLISLMRDQILHLKEAGVNAVMLTGGTPKQSVNEIQSRLASMATTESNDNEIKLCYVTPEKIAKNQRFIALLQKLYNGKKFARIVIDEAHCVSDLGHDFRPDYKKLSVLRHVFPDIPILALSATCPPKVLQDILKILQMGPVVDGKAAPLHGTVHFSAPLYRKNLHYTILPKPSSAKEVISTMSEYILQNHKNESGIVYCLTKKDAETTAEALGTISKGAIKTGVYHSDVPDDIKERLHTLWREGTVQVVCATIAFGLGIDKGNVRFVLHHTARIFIAHLSTQKSLDGYYQESGRAGRDGKDADCVLYYRPQDATRLSSIICSEAAEGQTKLRDMLRFAQDMKECRKILFAKYFSASSDLAMNSWTTEEANAMDRCNHCDNCTRPPESIANKDVTLEAWQILKTLAAVESRGGRVTINGIGDLARGLGGGKFDANVGGKRKKAKESVQLDCEAVAGGKLQLSKDDAEALIIHLLINDYLKEVFLSTAYTVNVYVVSGAKALRISRFSRADILEGKCPVKIECSFRLQGRKSKAAGKKAVARQSPEMYDFNSPEEDEVVPAKPLRKAAASKGKGKSKDTSDIVAVDEITDSEEDFTKQIRMVDELPESEEDDDEDETWGYSFRTSRQTTKRRRVSGGGSRKPTSSKTNDEDVISLSSD
ncbi:P-loop containing nucleoside triphosphate hydrolase protein [Hygrophoropsis aurantiaca]|uniref:P-loop containing nucleoside triphosphate hydrolase protein n=1 Tax=Hygrophoropsis aurantiaca TaxID=72124 RepID=A0ACB8AHL7_9AGAM|nr:P-loop containing nucleoside triphosphate hydrolase protein [Hygrophoropsis aurantiaca]